jgi:serpin B
VLIKESKETEPVKAGDKISGTVSDEVGPLMGATVCEIDAKGRVVESAITDNNGHFVMKVRNPQDRLRFSYVGMKTITIPIAAKKYEIIMELVENRNQYRYIPADGKKQTGLPIPVREVDNATKPIDMTEFEFEGLVFVADSLVGHAPPRDFPFAEVNDEGVTNENNPRVQVSLTDEEQALVTSVNNIGFNMFRKVGAKESILLSPLGMTYALGLINNGAAGKTRAQIKKVLGSEDKEDKVNEFCRKMLTEAPRLDRLTNMEITNEFFSPKSSKPKPDFMKVAKDLYDTQFHESESNLLNFTLVNTIYFKGIWTDKFFKANTEDEVFKGEDGKETMVPMMNQRNMFFYTENDFCQTLCLPYSNGAYQMIILLPKEGKTVREVAQSLTADSWEKSYDQMRRISVDVKLPRFESESEVNLTGMMSALMPNAFSMKKADFSNLFDIESYICKIKQKGHIKVDETGTEATVTEALQGRIMGLDLVQPDMVHFHATHPFLYFIREWSTGAIFFIGQYMGS